MNKVLVSITAIGLGYFAVACGSESGSSSAAGGGSQVGGSGGGEALGVGGGVPSGGSGVTGGAQGVMGGAQGVMGGATGASGGIMGGAPGVMGGAPGVMGGAPGVMGGAPGITGGADGTTGGAPGVMGGAPGITGGADGITGGADGTTGGTDGNTGGAMTGGSDGVGGSAGSETGGSGGGVVPDVITSSEGDYWQTGSLILGGTNVEVTVNDTQTYQDWHGFGATFNEAGWDALLELSEADRTRAMRLLFDQNDGIGFTWGRIPVGASDYAMTRYTLNDHAGDTSMSYFSIDHDRDLLIPFIQAAQTVKADLKFWGSPWTPPPWMKDGGENQGYDKGVMKSDATTFAAMALYLVRFVQEYTAIDIPIEIMMPQNEPGWAQGYPSCAWGPFGNNPITEGPVTMGTFVELYMAPAFETANLDTRIWYGTFSNNSTFDSYWAGLSPAGRQLIEGVALQWGTGEHVAEIANAGLLVMQSEHQCGNYPWLEERATSAADANRDNFLPSMAPNNYAYGQETWDLIKDWIELGVNFYSAWNMVLDTEGFNLDLARPWPQNALLAVDRNATTDKLKITPAYYVFRHVAQYVAPGAVRIGTSGGDALAFKNPDGSIVTVLYNQGAARTMTIAVGGSNLQFAAPANGWATINWRP